MKVLENMRKCDKVWKKNEKVWGRMRKDKKVWESTLKYEEVTI